VQLIFQDPIASLNPRRRIGDIVAEPLVISGVKDPTKRKERACGCSARSGSTPLS
jgi:peptide/nickel transport system ATP-binding protein